MSDDGQAAAKFKIFRGDDAPDALEAGVVKESSYTPELLEKYAFLKGGEVGADTRLMFNMPGFSLIHMWLKRDFPLPLHSHDADCLYYVISGSLQLGTETLGPRDGFFVGANVPYTYTAGPEGVEILEFRHATQVDNILHGRGDAFWKKAAETIALRREEWKTAPRPASKP